MAKLKTVEALEQKLTEAQQDNHGRKARIAELERVTEEQARTIDGLRKEAFELAAKLEAATKPAASTTQSAA